MTASKGQDAPKRASQSEHPIVKLPFVADGVIEDRRCFWAVDPPDNYIKACEMGKEFALSALSYGDGVNSRFPLQWAVLDLVAGNGPMNDGQTGLVVGFYETVGYYAHVGFRIVNRTDRRAG